MSTIVEHPMSVINGVQPSSSRSLRDSIEIIDVDSFDHGGQPQAVPPGNIRTGTSSQDSIWLIDSESDDDEVEFLSSRVLASHNVDRTRSHRQFISPPPQRNSNQALPPVPALPSSQATRQPVRRQYAMSSMPVFPSAQPPAFEVGPVAGPSNAPNPPNPPQAAPISRHVPALGLGGALISSNNRAQNIRRQARSAAAATSRNATTNMPGQYHFQNYDDIPRHIQMYLTELAFQGSMGDLNTFQRHHFLREPREKEQYQQHYTHPSKAEPGFTFDFAPQDDDASARLFPPTSANEPIILDDDDDDGPSHAGPSKSSSQGESSGAGTLNAMLVCAKCLDPLVLNAGLAPEEAQYKRVWGLRCGHLIDEKCLNELGQPPQEPAQEEGKPPTTAPKDRKGKGKGKAVVRPTYGDALSEPHVPAETDASNNIRSRLRARPNARPSSSSTTAAAATGGSYSLSSLASASSSALSHLADLLPSPPTKKRRGPPKKPKIEGEFEWKCPVANCGHVHLSVKINGIWGPETDRDFKGVKGIKGEARGAIAVFA